MDIVTLERGLFIVFFVYMSWVVYLTGETKAVSKTIDDTVFTGTINTGPAIFIRLTDVAGQSMLDHIIRSVRYGQARRAPLERLADRITAHFVPISTFITIITWMTWMALGLSGAFPADDLDIQLVGRSYWSLQFATAVFVICDCRLCGSLSPWYWSCGINGSLRRRWIGGKVWKSAGEAFQEASKVDVIIFDKTGTLTVGGEPKVVKSEFVAANEVEEQN